MMDLLEIYRRANSGPIMTEDEFNLERFYPILTKITKKYGIKYDSDNPVNQSDEVADLVFKAAVDLITETGVYCLDSQRVIEFTRDEVEQTIREAPGPCWFGEGHDRKLFKPRKPDDPTPPWIHASVGTPMSSDELAFRVMEGAARIHELDIINIPSISHLRDIPVSSGTPVEVLASIQLLNLARQAFRQSGRPGIPIWNVIPTSASPLGMFAASHPDLGGRTTDGYLTGFIAEMKIDYAALNKVALIHSLNANVVGESGPVLGGYCGGPEGTAITNTAYAIGGILVLRAHVQTMLPVDMNMGCTTTRRVLWATGVSDQAISRNLDYPFINSGYAKGGPMTKSFFYEATAYLLTAIASGASSAKCVASGAVVIDHHTPMEFQYSADVLRVAAKLNRTDVNEIVKNLLNLYEENLSSASEGKRYQDCYDVKSGLPQAEYLEFYHEIKKEIFEMGVPFDL